MFRRFGPVAVFVLTVSFVIAQDEIRRGTVKTVDAEKGTVTITVNGKDETFFLTADTEVKSGGKAVAKPFEDKGLNPGSEVLFKSATRDGKAVLTAMRLGVQPAAQPKVDTSKLRPLPELGMEKYQNF